MRRQANALLDGHFHQGLRAHRAGEVQVQVRLGQGAQVAAASGVGGRVSRGTRGAGASWRRVKRAEAGQWSGVRRWGDAGVWVTVSAHLATGRCRA